MVPTLSGNPPSRQYPEVSYEAKTHPDMLWVLVEKGELTEEEVQEFDDFRKVNPDVCDVLLNIRLPDDLAKSAFVKSFTITEYALHSKGSILAQQDGKIFVGFRFEGTADERKELGRRLQQIFRPARLLQKYPSQEVEERLVPNPDQPMWSTESWEGYGIGSGDEVGLDVLQPSVLSDFEYPSLSNLCERRYTGPPIPVEELIRRAEIEDDPVRAAQWFRSICFDCGYGRWEVLQAIEESEYARYPTFVKSRKLIRECYDFRFIDGSRIPVDRMNRGDDRFSGLERSLRRHVTNRERNGTTLDFLWEIAPEINNVKNDPPLTEIEMRLVIERAAKPLPEIVTSNRPLRDITDDAIRALKEKNFPPTVFVSDDRLVVIRKDEQGNSISVPLDVDLVKRLMTESSDYISVSSSRRKSGKVHVSPPPNVANDILAQSPALLGFPSLAGIVRCPVVRPDGTILDSPGYDSAARLFYDPGTGIVFPDIPTRPTSEQLRDAVSLISNELLFNFPFQSSADRANLFAALLTPLVRSAIHGCVPLFLIESPQAGTGKGLLASIISWIATGHAANCSTVPNSDEEIRKRITALLLRNPAIVVLDNVETELNSPSLAALLTATSWQDRLLQFNKIVCLKNNAIWFVTGNNVRLGGDLPRRTVRIRIDAQTARPWNRTDFKHSDLEDWTKRNRPDLVAALLTIVRAYFAAGQPRAGVPRLGSFVEWCGLLGGILQHAGIEGFLSNFHQIYEETDDNAVRWERLLELLHDRLSDDAAAESRPFTTREAISHIPADADMLPDAVIEAKSQLEQLKASQALGRAFRQVANRRFGRYRIVRATTDTNRRVATWQVIME